MSNLNKQIEETKELLNNIKSALEDKGVDTSSLKPTDYPNAINNITGETTVTNLGFLPVLIFQYADTRPEYPDGGAWDPSINSITAPDGWYTDIEEDFNSENRKKTLWMSYAVFANDGTTYKRWSKPVKISGKDGEDGKQGVPGLPGNIAGVTQYFSTYLYTVSNNKPTRPVLYFDVKNKRLEGVTNNGWTELLNSGPEDIVWQCTAMYDTSSSVVNVTDPVRISAESSKVNGVIRRYMLKSKNEMPSHKDSGWEEWRETENIAPTEAQNFLYAYDETVYNNATASVTPVFLMATYVAGLIDIDLNFTCAPSEEDAKNQKSELWFSDSEVAIRKSEDGQYEGLNENTKYLWCRETYEFNNKESQHFYSIISYYKAAEKAPILYSAGNFNPRTVYTRTDEQCPYVFYPEGLLLDENDEIVASGGKEYNYFFLKNSYEENSGLEFEEAYRKEYWRKIESFEAIYSDIGIFKAAEVGRFIFDQNYMFSQFGSDNDYYSEYADAEGTVTNITYDKDTKTTTCETVAKTGISAAISDGRFVPSTLINAVTGEAWFAKKNAHFKPNGEWTLGKDENQRIHCDDKGTITLTGITLNWKDISESASIENRLLNAESINVKQAILESLKDNGDIYNAFDTYTESNLQNNGKIAEALANATTQEALITKINGNSVTTGNVLANNVIAGTLTGKTIIGSTIKNDDDGSVSYMDKHGVQFGKIQSVFRPNSSTTTKLHPFEVDSSGDIIFRTFETDVTDYNYNRVKNIIKIGTSGINISSDNSGHGYLYNGTRYAINSTNVSGTLSTAINIDSKITLNDSYNSSSVPSNNNKPLKISHTISLGNFDVTGNGTLTMVGKISTSAGLYHTSDKILKDFKKDIDIDFLKLKQIPKKYFTWKDNNKDLQIGTSAQEVQKLYPEIVAEINGKLTVDYSKLSIVALAAVDKLYEELMIIKETSNNYGNRY